MGTATAIVSAGLLDRLLAEPLSVQVRVTRIAPWDDLTKFIEIEADGLDGAHVDVIVDAGAVRFKRDCDV